MSINQIYIHKSQLIENIFLTSDLHREWWDTKAGERETGQSGPPDTLGGTTHLPGDTDTGTTHLPRDTDTGTIDLPWNTVTGTTHLP